MSSRCYLDVQVSSPLNCLRSSLLPWAGVVAKLHCLGLGMQQSYPRQHMTCKDTFSWKSCTRFEVIKHGVISSWRWLFCSCRVCLGPASHEMQFWGLVGEKQTGHIFKSQDRNHLAEDLRVVVSAVWKCMRFWTWGSPIKLAATVPAVFIVFVVLQFPWSILMENPIYTITTIMTILTTENIATITFCYDQTRSVIPD